MHILKDENGNPIPHGGHEHTHEHEHCHEHEHEHHHHHHNSAKTGDKSLALLSYMYDHNVDHTRELLDMAAQIETDGKPAVAAKMRKAADAFNQGNDLLHEALHLYEE